MALLSSPSSLGPGLRLLSLGLLFLFTLASSASITISSWNVQVFGTSKMSNPSVVEVLVQNYRSWELVMMMEIRDSSNTSAWSLLAAINNYTGPQYELVVSPRLGPTTSKEQYGFFYRRDTIKVIDQFLFADPTTIFARPPYNVLFELPGGRRLFIVPIHTTPTDAVNEINGLKAAYQAGKERFGVAEGIIMGDFNADCSYVSASAWASIPLKSDPDFTWLIGDEVDTTTGTTDCAYDRFVMSKSLVDVYESGSAQVINFTQIMALSEATTLGVSDHYPITLRLTIPDPTPTSSQTDSTTLIIIVVVVILLVLVVSATIFLFFWFYWRRRHPSSASSTALPPLGRPLVEGAARV